MRSVYIKSNERRKREMLLNVLTEAATEAPEAVDKVVESTSKWYETFGTKISQPLFVTILFVAGVLTVVGLFCAKNRKKRK